MRNLRWTLKCYSFGLCLTGVKQAKTQRFVGFWSALLPCARELPSKLTAGVRMDVGLLIVTIPCSYQSPCMGCVSSGYARPDTVSAGPGHRERWVPTHTARERLGPTQMYKEFEFGLYVFGRWQQPLPWPFFFDGEKERLTQKASINGS